ncbi:hypothetical protein GCM10027280_53470 [Micromonospora polyrhachis]|uniref:AcrR family transcriptional regulator n=1 Tax=Micromonospora polyrhachis TaxID=1282883 RepID=A0A7W7SK80_9ACTN|nr:TetR family transcriptional regulator [Micromonospora polyrhachis]MBB4956323.1 AcrR family transcriptional regulator [Micromonospora polyrhachis]
MPENERRAEIMDAVERLLGRGGVNAVTMRAVASEAGVSLRLVQYYGKNKDALLTATLDRLADRSIERWRSRSERQGASGSAIDQVKAFLDEALPTDAASRGFHRVGVSLEALAITHPGVAGQAYQVHLRALADHLVRALRSDTHLSAAAARLLALEVMGLAHGLGTLLMADQLTESEAESLTADYLERLRPRLSH